jgi:hypothetical protein
VIFAFFLDTVFVLLAAGGAFFLAKERFLAAAGFSTTLGASFGFRAPGVVAHFLFDLLFTRK